MIHECHGDLLDAKVDALVNPVNTVGVMGAGLALGFKHRFPEMFVAYRSGVQAGEVRVGRMHVWPTDLARPRLVVGFPTKRHWRDSSRLEDIEAGLGDLVRVVTDEGVMSLAVPALGCGLGGLGWSRVRPLIVGALGDLPGVDVWLYPPQSTRNLVVV